MLTRDFHRREEEEIFGRTDCNHPEAGRDGNACRGPDSACRDHRTDLLQMEKAYAGLESDQVRELKQVLEENARLKKLVAELSLDKSVLQDVLSKKFPGQRL